MKNEDIGIDKNNFKKISEPFFSLKAKGTGLDSSISNRLTNTNKGLQSVEK
jgi:hypothetical protein